MEYFTPLPGSSAPDFSSSTLLLVSFIISFRPSSSLCAVDYVKEVLVLTVYSHA